MVIPKSKDGRIKSDAGVDCETDTDCDPDMVDLPIPGNDDSIRSIELMIKLLADAVLAGRAASGALKQEPAQASAPVDLAAEKSDA